jgi:hypothetical protein
MVEMLKNELRESIDSLREFVNFLDHVVNDEGALPISETNVGITDGASFWIEVTESRATMRQFGS